MGWGGGRPSGSHPPSPGREGVLCTRCGLGSPSLFRRERPVGRGGGPALRGAGQAAVFEARSCRPVRAGQRDLPRSHTRSKRASRRRVRGAGAQDRGRGRDPHCWRLHGGSGEGAGHWSVRPFAGLGREGQGVGGSLGRGLASRARGGGLPAGAAGELPAERWAPPGRGSPVLDPARSGLRRRR